MCFGGITAHFCGCFKCNFCYLVENADEYHKAWQQLSAQTNNYNNAVTIKIEIYKNKMRPKA